MSGDALYQRCDACGLIQLGSQLGEAQANALYGDLYFSGGGAGYPGYLEERTLLREHGRRYAGIVAAYMPRGRLLDVGGAAGHIAQGFCDAGWDAMVLDPNRRMAAIAASLGEQTHVGVLETFDEQRAFELVVMIQVIAHFFDLRTALARAAAANVDGGHLLVETWNSDSTTARIFRSRWHEFSPPSVRRIFTPSALDHALAHYGYARVASGRPHKWLSGAHAKSLLAYKAGRGLAGQASAMLARLIPDGMKIPYPAEDLFWALYRKRAAVNVRERAESSVA